MRVMHEARRSAHHILLLGALKLMNLKELSMLDSSANHLLDNGLMKISSS